MSTQTTPLEFRDLINNVYFPHKLLESIGEDRLFEQFTENPARFTRNALYASACSNSKWDTPHGRELLQKFDLTKADVIRWSK